MAQVDQSKLNLAVKANIQNCTDQALPVTPGIGQALLQLQEHARALREGLPWIPSVA
jgi:hypothetical protein